MSTPVIVTAVFTPVAGKKDELVAALTATIPAVHAEEGCELYAIHDASDGTITMLEKWDSADLLAAHAAGTATAALNAAIDGLIAQPVVVTTMTAIPTGTAEQGAL
jgi:quinol monooxygenase YgiN